MRRRITNGAVLLTAALALAAAGPAAAQPGAVGTMAPDFNLEPNWAAGYRSLSQHRGEVVFLAIIGYG